MLFKIFLCFTNIYIYIYIYLDAFILIFYSTTVYFVINLNFVLIVECVHGIEMCDYNYRYIMYVKTLCSILII